MANAAAELYRRSSQYRLWSFTEDQLTTRISERHAMAASDELALTPQDELIVVLYYASEKIKDFCEVFALPSQVRATSVVFFRRFYLENSVLEYDPRLMLPTCVFLASKAENYFIPIAKFCEPLTVEPPQIMQLEFALLKALKFTLTVHNALKPLHGFFLDMQANTEGFEVAELATIHDSAKKIIIDAFVSDVVFLYTPTHIALAALMEVNELLTTQYMASCMDGPNTSLDKLLEMVQACRQKLFVAQPPKTEVKAIVKKLVAHHKTRHLEGPPQKRVKV